MSYRLSDKDKSIFNKCYESCIQTFLKDAQEHRRNLLDVAKETEFEHDWKEFAVEAFLHNMKMFYDTHTSLRSAVKETRKILEG